MKALTGAAIAALIVLATPASAQDAKPGWEIQFRQDTFDKTVFPLAMVTEDSDGFDKAMLVVGCAKDGSLIAAYNPSAIISLEQTATVQFRGVDATKEFTFAPIDIPHLGKFRALGKADSAALVDLVSKSSGEVPFRAETKQGVFPSIGAVEVFQIVRDHCSR